MNNFEDKIVNLETKEIHNAYSTLSKKVYFCKNCLSHKVCDKNETVTNCSRCGSAALVETPFPFVPLSYKSIKDMDTLDINEDDLMKYAKEMQEFLVKTYDEEYAKKNDGLDGIYTGKEIIDKYCKWFLHRGVVKLDTGGSYIYLVFNTLGDKKADLSAYIYRKHDGSFGFICRYIFQDNYGDYAIERLVYNPFYFEKLKQDNAVNTEGQQVLSEMSFKFSKAQYVFNYLAMTQKVEQIRCEVDKDIKREITSSRGNTKTKKRRVIYMTDTVKVYTYDETMANKIRQHRPISMPFWKVREFNRRVFAKEDRGLPKDLRRVVKVSNIKPFLKGRERMYHTVDECQILYKIAR